MRPKKDRVEQKIRLTRENSDFIDRVAQGVGISYSDVVNFVMELQFKGIPLPFQVDRHRTK